MQKYNRARKHKTPRVSWDIYHKQDNPHIETDCGFFTDGGSFCYVDKLYNAGIKDFHSQTSENVENRR
jgi:hypothetical protein